MLAHVCMGVLRFICKQSDAVCHAIRKNHCLFFSPLLMLISGRVAAAAERVVERYDGNSSWGRGGISVVTLISTVIIIARVLQQ